MAKEITMQEQSDNEDTDIDIGIGDVNKDMKKSDRMLRSVAARTRRKELRQIRETRILTEWAKARRERKSK